MRNGEFFKICNVINTNDNQSGELFAAHCEEKVGNCLYQSTHYKIHLSNGLEIIAYENGDKKFKDTNGHIWKQC